MVIGVFVSGSLIDCGVVRDKLRGSFCFLFLRLPSWLFLVPLYSFMLPIYVEMIPLVNRFSLLIKKRNCHA